MKSMEIEALCINGHITMVKPVRIGVKICLDATFFLALVRIFDHVLVVSVMQSSSLTKRLYSPRLNYKV